MNSEAKCPKAIYDEIMATIQRMTPQQLMRAAERFRELQRAGIFPGPTISSTSAAGNVSRT